MEKESKKRKPHTEKERNNEIQMKLLKSIVRRQNIFKESLQLFDDVFVVNS